MQTKEEILKGYTEAIKEAKEILEDKDLPQAIVTLIQPFYLDTLLDIRDILSQACGELAKINHPLMLIEDVPKPEEDGVLEQRYAGIDCQGIVIYTNLAQYKGELSEWDGLACFKTLSDYKKALATPLDEKVAVSGLYRGFLASGEAFRVEWDKEILKIKFKGTGLLIHEDNTD